MTENVIALVFAGLITWSVYSGIRRMVADPWCEPGVLVLSGSIVPPIAWFLLVLCIDAPSGGYLAGLLVAIAVGAGITRGEASRQGERR